MGGGTLCLKQHQQRRLTAARPSSCSSAVGATAGILRRRTSSAPARALLLDSPRDSLAARRLPALLLPLLLLSWPPPRCWNCCYSCRCRCDLACTVRPAGFGSERLNEHGCRWLALTGRCSAGLCALCVDPSPLNLIQDG